MHNPAIFQHYSAIMLLMNEDRTPAILRRADHFYGDFPLALSRIHSHADCSPHTHEFGELVIVLRGRGLHITEYDSWPIGAGDVFVLQGRHVHGYVNTSQLDLVNIMFVSDELDMREPEIAQLPGFHVLFTLEPRVRRRHRFRSRLCLDAGQLHSVNGLIDRLERELCARPIGWRRSARACFTLIVTELSRQYSRVDTPAAAALRQLGEALSYIEANLREAPTAADIAMAGKMSPRTLTRAFHAALACSPIEYVVRLRITRAMELLRSTAEPVAEIAYRLGYRDGSYFSRQFRERAGLSPSEYRKASRPPS